MGCMRQHKEVKKEAIEFQKLELNDLFQGHGHQGVFES